MVARENEQIERIMGREAHIYKELNKHLTSYKSDIETLKTGK